MVSTRGRGRGRGRGDKNEIEKGGEGGNGTKNRAEYEESRAQRIKENMERMKSLGILDLSKQLNRRSFKLSSSSSLRKAKPTPPPSNDPPRRSFRLKDMPRVSYSEKKIASKDQTRVKNVEIHIPEGENPEIYTEEHDKLLGDSEAVWTLFVDGYDEDGQRIYDPVEGKSCHQCRQKTLGQHTKCSKCEMVTGQFCGDCLYMRYGENVTEVHLNPDWICPVCRGICNCSRCRRDKGWAPTGAIYRKVMRLGFKSVAHYLIYTRRGQAMMEVAAAESPISVDGSLSGDEGIEGSSDVFPQSGAADKNETGEANLKVDGDEEYRGDDYEGDDVSQ